MRDQFLNQTGLYLVVIANMVALYRAVAAEPTPVAVPTPGLEILPGSPSETESEPSELQTPAGAAPTVSFDYGISSEGQIFQMALGYAF